MAWTYTIGKTRYLAFHQYSIPYGKAEHVRKVDGRLKKYSNLKPCKYGYKIM